MTGLPPAPGRTARDRHRSLTTVVLALAASALSIPGVLLPWARNAGGVQVSLIEGYPGVGRLEVFGEVLSVLAVPIVVTGAALMIARGSRAAAAGLVAIAVTVGIATTGTVVGAVTSRYYDPEAGFWAVVAGRVVTVAAGVAALRIVRPGRRRASPRPDQGGAAARSSSGTHV